MVREYFAYNRAKGEFETDSSLIGCRVWGDSWSEDYTDEHTIAVYEEEEP